MKRKGQMENYFRIVIREFAFFAHALFLSRDVILTSTLHSLVTVEDWSKVCFHSDRILSRVFKVSLVKCFKCHRFWCRAQYYLRGWKLRHMTVLSTFSNFLQRLYIQAVVDLSGPMHGVQDFVSEAIAFASKITETFTLLRLNLRSHPLATFSPCERLSHSDESHSELSNARTATFVSQSRARNVADLGAVHTSAVRFTWDRSKSKAMWIVLDSRSKRVWDRSKRVWTLSQSKPGSIWDRPRFIAIL